MPSKNTSLHGNASDKATAALPLIDVINDLDFPEGDQLLTHALPAAKKIRALKRRARTARVPVIYVNDNYGRWRSNFAAQVAHCLNENCRGLPIAQLLKPDESDYFVLKAKHSGFYCTALELLLSYLGVTSVIIAGFAGNNCVLFTANDAFLRDLDLHVPRDCVASNTDEENRLVLAQMRTSLKADTRPSNKLDLKTLNKPAKQC